jgi:hypothetical protein
MPTLTCWVARVKDGHPAYNLRDRTRRELRDHLKDEYGITGWRDYFEAPAKVSVEYTDPFHLMIKCLGEDRGYWEDDRGDRFAWTEDGDLIEEENPA